MSRRTDRLLNHVLPSRHYEPYALLRAQPYEPLPLMPRYRLTCLQPPLVTNRPERLLSRKSPSERIRGTTLQTIRARHFEANPLCVECLKKSPPITRIWTQLDHVIPLQQGGIDSRDVAENRQGLCVECHDAKTAREATERAKKWRGGV